jgi:hypothetical protein
MKRCPHARPPRRESYGALSTRRLESKAIETTHTEALELIAKALGYENWNILSAKIEEASGFNRRDVTRSTAHRLAGCAHNTLLGLRKRVRDPAGR